jgi:hypothetical protein
MANGNNVAYQNRGDGMKNQWRNGGESENEKQRKWRRNRNLAAAAASIAVKLSKIRRGGEISI